MIIQAELKCKQTGCEADPCAVAVWILRNTVRTAWEMTARQNRVRPAAPLRAAVPGAAAGAEDDVSKSGSIHLERAA